MVNALIRWSLTNRLAVVLASAVLLGAGAYVVKTVPVDVFPDLTAPTVTVMVEGSGMAPEEMETLVTFQIETSVNGAAGVRRVRSATTVGFAVVWVEFEWGTDIYRARQTVSEKLVTLAGKLPTSVDTPVLGAISSIMGEVQFIAIASDRHSPLDLRSFAYTDIRRRLLAVLGVAQVTVLGGDEKQYQVVLSPQRLRAYRISTAQVAEALQSTNENISAGFLVHGGQESIIQGIGRIESLDDIRSTVVALRDDTPIKISDLGVVRIGAAIPRGIGSASHRNEDWTPVTEPAVIISIQKQPGANTLALTKRLDAVLDEIAEAAPEGMHIDKGLFKQATFIEASIANTIEALRDGSIMVIIIVILFLASARSSIITLLAIPISLIVTILTLKLLGASINTMTLGGMAIAIGALVDDAIIDVENVVRRLRENAAQPQPQRRPHLDVILDASVEVRSSIVFATAIILLVFMPLFFLSGVEGRLLRPLGIAFCVSIAASLLTALTLTPALSAYLLPNSTTIRDAKEPRLVRFLKRLYEKPLAWSLRRPAAVLVPTVFLLLGAGIAASRMGSSFLPAFNEGAYVVGIVTVPGTSLEESNNLAHLAQKAFMKHPEIVTICRRTGRAEEDEHTQGVEATELEVMVDMQAPARLGLPGRTRDQLVAALRADLALIPGISATFGQPIGHRIDHMLSGTRANIAVKIFGADLPTLRNLARRAESIMKEIPGIVDLTIEQQMDIPILRIDFDRQAISRYGLKIAEVAQAVETAFQGHVATQVLEGKNAYDLVLRVGDPKLAADWMNATAEDVGEVLVDTPGGTKIPLKALARISEERGPNMVMRENAQRRIIVQCNVAGRDLGGVVDEIREKIATGIEFPQGYFVDYGGQFENAEKTRTRLALLGTVAILGIALLLQIAFGSMRDALLIMVNLPLALIGGVAGVYLSGGTLSVASLIGFISVLGIAARNGIMMVSHIRHLQRHEGVTDFAEAVRRGAMERLAPILMTALCAGFALIPLVLGRDEPGKEILSPMAFVILSGLLSATFLNMIVVPALFLKYAHPQPPALAEENQDAPPIPGASVAVIGS